MWSPGRARARIRESSAARPELKENACGAAFQRRELFLQGVAGGVGAAAVLVAVAQAADAVLGIGGAEVHRRDHGAGARLEGLAGVHGAGVETGGFQRQRHWRSFRPVAGRRRAAGLRVSC